MVVTRLLTVLCLVATAHASGAARWSVDAVSTPLLSTPGTTPEMQQLLRMAGEQVVAFGRDLEGIVAREAYVQTVRQWPASVPKSPGKGRLLEERHLRSDLLLVHDPSVPWQIHRDVLAVDGHDLAGREQRLRQLFSSPGLDVRALRLAIIEDSSRHNLGHIERNINIPTFPLVVLHPEHQWRFAFRDRGMVADSGRAARLISFGERGRLRVIRDGNGRDVRTEGSFLLDGVTGELLRATMEPRAADLYPISRSHSAPSMACPAGCPYRCGSGTGSRARGAIGTSRGRRRMTHSEGSRRTWVALASSARLTEQPEPEIYPPHGARVSRSSRTHRVPCTAPLTCNVYEPSCSDPVGMRNT